MEGFVLSRLRRILIYTEISLFIGILRLSDIASGNSDNDMGGCSDIQTAIRIMTFYFVILRISEADIGGTVIDTREMLSQKNKVLIKLKKRLL